MVGIFLIIYFLFILFIFIYLFNYWFTQKYASKTFISSSQMFNQLIENNTFYDIKKSPYSNEYFSIYFASSHGENYMLGIDQRYYISLASIALLYEEAQKQHLHNIVVICNFKQNIPPNVFEKIIEYDIKIWDNDKLKSMLDSKVSPLETSDVSDDTCSIEENSDDPIKNVKKEEGFIKRLFKKPDRL